MVKTKDNQHSATNDDILMAINDFASQTEHRFINIENEVTGIKNEVTVIKNEVTGIRSIMVTKDYLDDKLADLRADLVLLMRKGNSKLMTLVNKSADKKVLTRNDVAEINSIEPFAQ